MGITERERKAIKERRDVFCAFAIKEIEEHAGKIPDPMALFEEMPEEQKMQFVKKVLDDGLILLGLRKKKTVQIIEDEMIEIQNQSKRPNIS